MMTENLELIAQLISHHESSEESKCDCWGHRLRRAEQRIAELEDELVEAREECLYNCNAKDEARAEIVRLSHEIEGMQAHIDNVVHPDDCRSFRLQDLNEARAYARRLIAIADHPRKCPCIEGPVVHAGCQCNCGLYEALANAPEWVRETAEARAGS